MKKYLLINHQSLEYTVKTSSRARRLRLVVRADGTCVVTVPTRVPQVFVDQFVREKSDWIREKMMYWQQRFVEHQQQEPTPSFQVAKQEALTFVLNRLEVLNQAYSHPYKKVSVRNQKTRWGSCSTQGNLQFNYRILFLPQELVDYIVVHELCHLKEMNHSKRFWNLVAKTVPEYRTLRARLRTHSLEIIQ